MPDEQIAKVRELLAQHEKKYGDLASSWKLGYRVLLVISSLFSAGAAVVGKLKFGCATDVAAILAATVAVITTLIAALDFEVNWRINRRSRHEVHVIALESEKSTADTDNLLCELQNVVRRRNEGLNKQD